MKTTGKQKGAEKVTDGEEEKKLASLPAVIIADTYATKFRPVSFETPKVLMPLVNVPMIEYAVDFLIANKVKDIYIFSTALRSQIAKFFSKFQTQRGVTIKALSSEEATSLGDALREISDMRVIKGDFILMFGDVIADFALEPAVREHLRRRELSKTNIMTKIYRVLSPQSEFRTRGDEVFLGLDKATGQLLQIESLANQATFSLNDRIELTENPGVEVHFDLVDSAITICSQEVLNHLNENFDYHTLSDDLLKDLLTSEIYEDKIYAHILAEDEIALQVTDYRLYGLATKEIVRRGLPRFPVDHPSRRRERSAISYMDFNRYVHSSVELAHTAFVSDNSVIDRETKVGGGARVLQSVVGRKCVIGNNVVIRDSVLWQNVIIEDDVTIEGAIICDNVTLRAGTKVARGAVVSFGYSSQPKQSIPQSCFRYILKGEEAEAMEEFKLQPSETFAGPPPKFELEDDEPLEESDEEDEDEKEEGDRFEGEVREILKREGSSSEKVDIDNMITEIQSRRLAEKRTFADAIRAFMPEILKDLENANPSEGEVFLKALTQFINVWGKLMVKFINGSAENALVVLEELEKFCAETAKQLYSTFHLFLQLMYKLEVLTDEMVIAWADSREDSESEQAKHYLNLSKAFIDWLRSEEEEEEEAEEEEDK